MTIPLLLSFAASIVMALFPDRIPVPQVNSDHLQKILDNMILLTALMIAFVVTMPTAASYDDLMAADARCYDGRAISDCRGRGINWCPVSFTFLSHVVAACSLLGCGLFASFTISLGMLLVGTHAVDWLHCLEVVRDYHSIDRPAEGHETPAAEAERGYGFLRGGCSPYSLNSRC